MVDGIALGFLARFVDFGRLGSGHSVTVLATVV